MSPWRVFLPERRHTLCLMLWEMGHSFCDPNIQRLVLQVAALVLVTAFHWDITSGVCELPFSSEEHGVAVSGPRQTSQPRLH